MIELIKTLLDSMKNHSTDVLNFGLYSKVLKLLIMNNIQPTFELISLILETCLSELINVIKDYSDNGYILTQQEFNYLVCRLITMTDYDYLKLMKDLMEKNKDLKIQKEMLHFSEKDKEKPFLNIDMLEYIYDNVSIGQTELYVIFMKNVPIKTFEQIILKHHLSLDRNCLRNACTVNNSIIPQYLIDHKVVPDIECVDNICKTYGNTKYILKWIEQGILRLSLQNLKDLVTHMNQKEMKSKNMVLLIMNTFDY